MKVVINKCFGGFDLSDEAYELLIKYGIPVREYIQEKRNPKTRLYDKKIPSNEGKVIFDSNLGPKGPFNDLSLMGRYWETWLDEDRTNELLIKVVEELGKKASGRCGQLEIVEIPDGTEYTIEEYDGLEHIAEAHQTWG